MRYLRKSGNKLPLMKYNYAIGCVIFTLRGWLEADFGRISIT